jgi:predicted PurR-regulated permease PerM
MRIAAAWSWRFLVVVAALAVLYLGLGYLSEITVPVTIALLLCALLNPVKRLLVNHGWNPGLASTVVFIGGVLVVAGIISLVVEQFVAGAADLAERVTGGLDTVQNWLVTGPLQLSQDQIHSAATSVKQAVLDNREAVTSSAVTTATSVGRVVTGLVLVMFILFFFLRDGRKIWTWIVGLAPRRARVKIHDAADQAGWTLAGYVRATVLVAFVDAFGIGLGLVILGVPLALPLTAFVFLASFIPIIGALISGIVAVLVALVTVGLVKAIIVLAVVIAVQQLEAHVLQPVLMGRAVHVHPLAVALSIAAGVIIAGISGALLAVPIAACANAIVKSLAGKDGPAAENKDNVEKSLEEQDAQSTK